MADTITTPDKPKAPPAPTVATPVEVDEWFIIDRTATAEYPSRTHELIIDERKVPFTFTRNVPLPMTRACALKFLKHPEFILTDEKGNELNFRRPPKNPEDPTRVQLAPDQVVALFDELTTEALQIRVAMLPGGENVQKKAPREEWINFMRRHQAAEAEKVRKTAVSDREADGYTPDPDSLGTPDLETLF